MSLTIHLLQMISLCRASAFKHSRSHRTITYNAGPLKEVLLSLFSDWKITDKVCGGIADNGSNIVGAFTLLNIDHLPCIARTLKLAVNRSEDSVQRIIGCCKAIFTHFKRSVYKADLQATRNARIVKSVTAHTHQDCVTR